MVFLLTFLFRAKRGSLPGEKSNFFVFHFFQILRRPFDWKFNFRSILVKLLNWINVFFSISFRKPGKTSFFSRRSRSSFALSRPRNPMSFPVWSTWIIGPIIWTNQFFIFILFFYICVFLIFFFRAKRGSLPGEKLKLFCFSLFSGSETAIRLEI